MTSICEYVDLCLWKHWPPTSLCGPTDPSDLVCRKLTPRLTPPRKTNALTHTYTCTQTHTRTYTHILLVLLLLEFSLSQVSAPHSLKCPRQTHASPTSFSFSPLQNPSITKFYSMFLCYIVFTSSVSLISVQFFVVFLFVCVFFNVPTVVIFILNQVIAMMPKYCSQRTTCTFLILSSDQVDFLKFKYIHVTHFPIVLHCPWANFQTHLNLRFCFPMKLQF